jgi:RimJ/RimL family protein N-acetyltransferase
MRRAASILRDRYRSSSASELVALVWKALFRNERILIYCALLQQPVAVDRSVGPVPIVKGDAGELEHDRNKLQRVPWELMCDVYDGVKDFFVFRDAGNGALGHISWLYYNGDPNQTLTLGDRECEIRFCLTFPEFRGRGLYPAALRAIQRHLRERGFERCFICVRDDNRRSIRGIEKSGFRFAGRTRLRKIFGIPIGGNLDTKHLTAT